MKVHANAPAFELTALLGGVPHATTDVPGNVCRKNNFYIERIFFDEAERSGAPVVVVDFGTATTFDIVNAKGEYVGGIISPGILISAEALFAHASRLYRVDVRPPESLIGRNTAGAMQAGIYFGYVGLVDGILERLKAELPGLSQVVATGGQAELIAAGSKHIDRVEPLLTLIGLRRIHELNRGT
jgi:type III pantothenate kinase